MTTKITIPLLKSEDIECRVQTIKKNKNNKVFVVLLLYKNARTDMQILDIVFGIDGWKRKHNFINGQNFCTVSIWSENKQEWIDKEDVGIESFSDKEKGQSSDAFKRACFNIGIGRELYTSPMIYIELNDDEYIENNGKLKCAANFIVSKIYYDDDKRIIKGLEIVDRNNRVRFKQKTKK
jgi:hypothetical protein